MSEIEWRDRPIGELHLFVRPANVLRCNRVETVGQLMDLTVTDLQRMRNMGEASIQNVRESLAVHGLSLAQERPTPADQMAKLREEHEHCMQALMLGEELAQKAAFRMGRLLIHTRRTLIDLCERIVVETGTDWMDAEKIVPPLVALCEVETRGGTKLRAMLQRLSSGDYAWANGEKSDYRVAQVIRWRVLPEGEQ